MGFNVILWWFNKIYIMGLNMVYSVYSLVICSIAVEKIITMLVMGKFIISMVIFQFAMLVIAGGKQC